MDQDFRVKKIVKQFCHFILDFWIVVLFLEILLIRCNSFTIIPFFIFMTTVPQMPSPGKVRECINMRVLGVPKLILLNDLWCNSNEQEDPKWLMPIWSTIFQRWVPFLNIIIKEKLTNTRVDASHTHLWYFSKYFFVSPNIIQTYK